MKKIDKNKFGPWAIVTGASSGIGKEFARQLAASGINPVLVARRLPMLQELGKALKQQYGVDFRAIQADLSQPEFMETMTTETADLEIGLVVSNAGTGNPGQFLDLSEALLLNIVHLNAISHLRLTHYYGRKLAQRGRGGLILVSAMGALDGIPYMSNDAATKAYVTSLGQGIHVEFEKLGINTTVVIPGPTDTPVIDKFGIDVSNLPIKPMSVEKCVAEGLAALEANKATHLTGRLNRVMAKIIPASISRQINSKMLTQGLKNKEPQLAATP